MSRKKSTYITLSQRCHNLGYKSYGEYLASPAWMLTRKKYLRAYASKRCWCCGKNAKYLQVHHKTYMRLGKERLQDLVPVCRQCHQDLHDLVKAGAQLARAHTTLRNKRIRNGEFIGRESAKLPTAQPPSSSKTKTKRKPNSGSSVKVTYTEPWSKKTKRQQ